MRYIKQRRSALGYAVQGLAQAFRREHHLQLHGIAAASAIALGTYYRLGAHEWVAILTCIAMVIALELINSAIERMCDLVMPDRHPAVKYIKDVCAGAVLVACLFSVAVAALVFWPYLAPRS